MPACLFVRMFVYLFKFIQVCRSHPRITIHMLRTNRLSVTTNRFIMQFISLEEQATFEKEVTFHLLFS
jgi:hypothetical protein